LSAIVRPFSAASDGALFEPYMTLFFQAYDEPTLRSLKTHIIGIKLYPAGVTTHSEAGVQTIEDAAPTLALMQELAIPLLVHGETHGFVLDREREFLAVYDCSGDALSQAHHRYGTYHHPGGSDLSGPLSQYVRHCDFASSLVYPG
jgi:dihydroorotase